MTRTPIRCLPYGSLALLAIVFLSCAEQRRGPTTPTAVEVVSPRQLSWECVRLGAGSGAGWTFETPAVDCGSLSTPVPDAGVGLISAAPGNLRSTITGTTVRLDWNGLNEPVNSFLVEAGSAPTLANLARLNTGTASPALVVNNVPPGEYYVRVRAVGPDGIAGPPSNEIVVRVGGSSAGQLPPSGLRAEVAGNQVNLFWSAPADASPSSYVIEAGSAPALSDIVVFDTGSAATQLTANAPNGTYYVRVRAAGPTHVVSNEIVVITPGSVVECTYTVSANSAQVPSSGGEVQLNVVTQPGCSWSARSTSGFISLTSPNAVTGNGVARFSAGANNTGQAREGVVRIEWTNSGQAVTISQEATVIGGGGGGTDQTPPPCEYSVSPTDVPLSDLAGTFTINVATRAGCSWTASPGTASFATLTSNSSRVGPGGATFSVPPNTVSDRSGVSQVAGRGITVSQLGPPPPQQTGPPANDSIVLPPDQPSGFDNQQTINEPLPSERPNADVCHDCLVRPQTANTSATAAPNGAPGTFSLPLNSSNQQSFTAALIGLLYPTGPPQSSSHFRVNFVSPRTSANVLISVPSGQLVTLKVAVVRDTQLPTNYVTVPLTPTPVAFSKSSPANGFTNRPTSLSLVWGTSTGANSYEYCYDTTNNNSCEGSWTTNGAATSVSISGLAAATTYYWQVRARTALGTSEADGGTWWNFRTVDVPPPPFGKTNPANGQVDLPTTLGLSWQGNNNVGISYEYCYDTTNNNSCDGAWVPSGVPSATISGLNGGTTYYWQARTRNGFGATDADGGTWWSFRTAAPCMYSVSPLTRVLPGSSGSFNVNVTVTGTSCAAWSATSQSSFITFASGGGTVSGGATFNYDSNLNEAVTRTGSVRISLPTGPVDVVVVQAAGTTPELTRMSCSLEPTSRSIEGTTASQLEFANGSRERMRVYWLNHSGQRVLFGELQPGQRLFVNTFLTHPWISTDTNNICQDLFMPVSPRGYAILTIIRPD